MADYQNALSRICQALITKAAESKSRGIARSAAKVTSRVVFEQMAGDYCFR